MAPPRKEALRGFTGAEQATLERLAKATSERVDRVRRAWALLAVAQGQSYPQAARHAGMSSPSTVYYLVHRFNERGMAALAIGAGRGRSPSDDTTARAQIVAMAQQPPQRRPDGTATWSLSTLQQRLRRDGLPRLGTSTIEHHRAPFGGSCRRRAVRINAPAVGARPARRSGSARAEWEGSPLRRPSRKGADRAGLP